MEILISLKQGRILQGIDNKFSESITFQDKICSNTSVTDNLKINPLH